MPPAISLRSTNWGKVISSDVRFTHEGGHRVDDFIGKKEAANHGGPNVCTSMRLQISAIRLSSKTVLRMSTLCR